VLEAGQWLKEASGSAGRSIIISRWQTGSSTGLPREDGNALPKEAATPGCYWRPDPNSEDQIPVFCFRCDLCRKSFSVVPDGLLPYQRLSASDAEKAIGQGVDGRQQVPAVPSSDSKGKEATRRVGEVWSFLKRRF